MGATVKDLLALGRELVEAQEKHHRLCTRRNQTPTPDMDREVHESSYRVAGLEHRLRELKKGASDGIIT